MPTVYILAGPNGSGKTTFYSIALQNNFIERNLPFINVDIIVQSLGNYTEENYVKASEIYRQTVKKHLDSDNNFMIESNLADNRSYEWVVAMKKKGYDVVLYYLSTDDVTINIARVKRRVAEEGHDIPEEIIKNRYKQSHSYLKTKLALFKESYLIDNSTGLSKIEVKLANGVIFEKTESLQNWTRNIVSILEILNRK